MLFSKSDMSHAHPQNVLARFDLISRPLTSERAQIVDVQHYFVRERVVRNDVMSPYRTTGMVYWLYDQVTGPWQVKILSMSMQYCVCDVFVRAGVLNKCAQFCVIRTLFRPKPSPSRSQT